MKRRPVGLTLTLSATLVVALGLVPSSASVFHETTVHVGKGRRAETGPTSTCEGPTRA